MSKLTLEQVKSISPKILLKIINRAKKYLKNNDVYKKMCSEYDVDVDFIDLVPVKFGDLEVSARTDHGIITLNYKLLCDGSFFKNYHYLQHELTHVCQQCFGDRPTQGADEGDYLHNPYEVEGFQRQIEYIEDQFGEYEAENYVDHLLDHHDKEGKDRNNIREKLLEDI